MRCPSSPDPVKYDIGAGCVYASVLKDYDGGLDGVLGRGREEEYAADRVSRMYSVRGCFETEAFTECFLNKSISLLVLVFYEA